VRAVLDPNVLISAVLSPTGTPARVLTAWLDGSFDLVASPLLLAEMERALTYPKLRRRIEPKDAEEFVAWLGRAASIAPDPITAPPIRSGDPGDAYLIALAESVDAVLVSGDAHLLILADQLPIQSPRAFLERLGASRLGPSRA
jgi:uncharacterized protein